MLPCGRVSWQGRGPRGWGDPTLSVWQRLHDRSTLAHMGVGTVATWAPCMGAREATMLVSLEKPVGFQARAETQTPAPLCPFRRPGSPFCVALLGAVPQSTLCGGAAGLAPVSRRLQDTARSTAMSPSRRLGIAGRPGEGSTVAVWWPGHSCVLVLAWPLPFPAHASERCPGCPDG